MSHNGETKSVLMETLLRLPLILILSAAATLGQAQSSLPTKLQSPQMEESLGDAARIARAQRKKSKSSKVFTKADLSVLPSNAISVVGYEPAAITSKPVKETAESGEHDEQYWLRRFANLQDQITAVDLRIKQVKDDIVTFENDARKGISVPEVYFPLPELMQEKENLQKQMELLREEGRKGGAEPGWLR